MPFSCTFCHCPSEPLLSIGNFPFSLGLFVIHLLSKKSWQNIFLVKISFMSHVLTASLKFLWAYIVKSCSTNFSDNTQWKSVIYFYCARFSIQVKDKLISEVWVHQKWNFSHFHIWKLKNTVSSMKYCFAKYLLGSIHWL